ncbi:AraC family transcriptional regulator [Pseudonocardiaceae bacterium YIM PH 21723]|nr:AraC family transcriptional regulator [Pseudonocardiaceae bacterium YIM PH 21723]
MRNVDIDEVDSLDRDVIPIGNDYPLGHWTVSRSHRRAQVLYGLTGSMYVETPQASWTIEPGQAVLIPAGAVHVARMDQVSMRSLYLEPGCSPWFPSRSLPIDVSPLLRELLDESADLAPRYDPHGRDATILGLALHELRRASPTPVDLPLPAAEPLRGICREFLTAPRIDLRPAIWAELLHVSERTLRRRFRAETGIGLAEWRRRACVLHAVRLLATGRTVADIAAELGYAGPGVFSTMFREVTGSAPSKYDARYS